MNIQPCSIEPETLLSIDYGEKTDFRTRAKLAISKQKQCLNSRWARTMKVLRCQCQELEDTLGTVYDTH